MKKLGRNPNSSKNFFIFYNTIILQFVVSKHRCVKYFYFLVEEINPQKKPRTDGK